MPIQRNIYADLQSDAVCDFLKKHSEQQYDEDFDRDYWLVEQGYELSQSPVKDMTDSIDLTKEILLYTCINNKYTIKKNNNGDFAVGETKTRVNHALTFSPYAILLYKQDLDRSEKTIIQNAFDTFSPGVDDVDAAETDLLSQGIALSDYQVLLSFKLNRSKEVTFEDGQDRAFREHLGDEYEIITTQSEEVCPCDSSNFDIAAGPRRIERDNPDDADAPDELFEEILDNVVGDVPCKILRPVKKKAGTLFKYPEWKIVWVMKEIRIGPCKLMKTKLPQLYTRVSQVNLYAISFAEEQLLPFFLKILENCLIRSAIASALLTLVTGGNFLTAVAAFKIAMQACVSTQIADRFLKCIIFELAIVTDKSPWRPV